MQDTTCCHCGCVLNTEDQFCFDDEIYCEDCLEEVTVVCDRCNRILLEDDAYYESDDDDRPYCYHCHCQNNVIRNYYYKPEPIFYGSGLRYFGVELEVDCAGEDHVNAKKVLDIANSIEEFAYCNNPLCLYYFEEGFYLYASTKVILDSALETMGYLDLPYKEIDIADGEILKIAPNGHRSSCFFQPPPSICCYAPIYDDIWNSWYSVKSEGPEDYRRFLMDFGVTLGIPENELQFLHLSGYPDMDLEECIYNPNYRRLCLMEAGYYDEMEEEHEYLAAVPW